MAAHDLDDDDTWFEHPVRRASNGRLNLWLGLGVVAVGALGIALGAFANPPPAPDTVGESARTRARTAEGTRPLAGALLLERLDRAQSVDVFKVAVAPVEPVKEEPPTPPEPEVAPPEPEVVPEPEPAKVVKPARTEVAKVERPIEVKPVEPKPVEPKPEPTPSEGVPASTIEQALLDGKKHLDARRWAEAKAAFEKALAAAPGNTRALFGRGRALFELRQTSAAMKDFEAVLAAEPSHPNALLMAGSAAQELGRKDDARKFYERYLEAWPTGRRASEIKLLLERL